MARRSIQAILAASTASSVFGQQVLDLSALEWTLTSPNFSYISVPGHIPSQVHLDLYNAKVIGDPLYGLNDFNLRWIAFSNWTYTSAIIEPIQSNASSKWLLFNGLDTFTSIELCGKHVASTNNQFRQYFFDVTDHFGSCGTPTLTIDFGSAPIIANTTATLPGQNSWPYGVQQLYEFPNREFIRKEQNDFGWDWGPAFAPAGIWQPASLVQLEDEQIFVRNTLIDVYRENQINLIPPDQTNNWILNVSIDYLGSLHPGAGIQYALANDKNKTTLRGQLENVTSADGRISGCATVLRDDVELWWPIGMGSQRLYNLTLEITTNESQTVASISKRIGFRTVVVNMLPVSESQQDRGVAPGNNWHFEINGHEFYAKGSNFIPPDPFWPTVTDTRIRQLFESVVDGNQNMLRVWSSGAYLPDFVYDLADEMGILLWSEFQFGCALYPVDQAFLENVAEEVSYQVRRVNHHPSLAYWAGGNELENLELQLVNNSSPEEYPRYLAEYETLFLDTIAPIVFENSRSISYSPSSTTNGWLDLDFSRRQPITQRYENVSEGSIYGNTDFYNYNSTQAFNFSRYPVGRFANEFGYHSMPSLQSWQQAVDTEDLWFNSSVVMLRNHHPPPGGLSTDNFANASRGQAEMTVAAEQWYPVPNKTDSIANFSAWCHTTQIFQADFYRSQIKFYRRGSALPERQLGSLYWQLEDQWQAPTWSGIEYDGRWKVLHYVAKDIYQSVIITSFLNVTTHDFEVWVISDLWSPILASVNLTWFDWTGTRINIDAPFTSEVSVGAINGTKVLSGNLDSLISGHDPKDVLLLMQVSAEASLPNSNTTRAFKHQSWTHADRLSASNMIDPRLQLAYSNETSKFTVHATSGVAAWVWLDYPSGAVLNFDDNAFWLLPGESKQVGYKVKSDTTGGAWVHGVTVRSIWDNTVS
ncbi:glycoside hydrolase family 2 protein [Corynespora cassiicola Philippines]|uniref:Beta-mannosidase A n=1 Tax=Corynespora cassiicola Philippines TaxID=1448308 RepID=A0A2T2P668_CORCC|nr:glycoside hydrolase family 2 protein [Corynespora cassiicola Philippines]